MGTFFCTCSKGDEDAKRERKARQQNSNLDVPDHKSDSDDGSVTRDTSLMDFDRFDMPRGSSVEEFGEREYSSSKSKSKARATRSGSSKRRKRPSYSAPSRKPQKVSEYPRLFTDVATFLRSLPPKSKKQIWGHAVREKLADGTKRPLKTAESKRLVAKLLCDVVIVYLKFTYKKSEPYPIEQVLPWVSALAAWLHSHYPVIHKADFIDKTRVSNWLDHYMETR